MTRGITKVILLLLSAFFAFALFPGETRAEENDSLWRKCHYTSSDGNPRELSELWDMNSESGYVIEGPGDLTISWRDGVPARTLYLAWRTLPEGFVLTQRSSDGALLDAAQGETYRLNQLYRLNPETRSVTLSSAASMDLCSALIYGPDAMPKNYHPWKPTPGKLDYLLIVTHPDDDILFMGAIVPLYGVSRGLNGTILYTATRGIRHRCDEALNGAWVMGLRNHPIFAGFPNILPKEQYQREKEFSVPVLTEYYVRMLRRYRPEVVVTHDRKGEYGHWQHINVSEAVCDAVLLAADASYDPVSLAQYGTFQVKKLYLHLYPERVLTLDVCAPLPAFEGRTILEIASAAFAEHISQVKVDHYRVCNDGFYRPSDYGLFFSAVGADTGKNDLFEHVDARILSNYVPPTPTLAPTPAPTPPEAARLTAEARQAQAKRSGMDGNPIGRALLLAALTLGVFAVAGALLNQTLRKRENRADQEQH